MKKTITRRSFLKATGAGVAAAVAGTPLSETFAAAPVIRRQTTITVAHAWDIVFLERQKEFDQMFMEKYPDAKVEIINNTWVDHNNIVPTWASSGDLPDLIYVHGSRAFPWASEGLLVSVQEQAESDEAFNLDGIFPEALNLYKLDGVLYGIPYDHGPVILGYNKDMFDAEGLAYPSEDWTMDDMLEAAIALGGKQMQWGYSGYYGNVMGMGNESMPYMVGPWGASPWSEDEAYLDLDTPEAREGLNFWYSMIHEHKAATNQADADSFESAGGIWLTGLVGMFALASWGTPQMGEFANFNWDVAPWPAGPSGRKTGAFGSGYGITRDSEAKDVAWTYMSEYLSKEGMEFMWGSTGRGSPAREAAYQSWMDSSVAPEHAEYYLDALANYAITGHPYHTKAAGEVGDILNRYRDLMQTGDITVDEAITGIMDEANPVLAAAQEG